MFHKDDDYHSDSEDSEVYEARQREIAEKRKRKKEEIKRRKDVSRQSPRTTTIMWDENGDFIGIKEFPRVRTEYYYQNRLLYNCRESLSIDEGTTSKDVDPKGKGNTKSQDLSNMISDKKNSIHASKTNVTEKKGPDYDYVYTGPESEIEHKKKLITEETHGLSYRNRGSFKAKENVTEEKENYQPEEAEEADCSRYKPIDDDSRKGWTVKKSYSRERSPSTFHLPKKRLSLVSTKVPIPTASTISEQEIHTYENVKKGIQAEVYMEFDLEKARERGSKRVGFAEEQAKETDSEIGNLMKYEADPWVEKPMVMDIEETAI